MMAQREEQNDEPKLSFVILSDDNLTMHLNGESKYPVKLPANISKKNSADQMRIIESKLLGGCNNYGLDYVSEDNIRNRAKEILDQLHERSRQAKNYVAPPSHPLIINQYSNDYLEFLISCINKTVKEENALVRQITYTLLSAYTPDPINLADIAPTSAGKTYPILEAAKFVPDQDISKVGSMSPRVLVRQNGGVLVDRDMKPIKEEVKELKKAIAKARKKKDLEAVEDFKDELSTLLEGSAYILDLSNKTLLFLEPPKSDLWELVKPILSHDAWEMEHPFVDKTAGGEMQVKRVITRGFPGCIFCSAKDESKREVWAEIASRFMVVSPNMIRPKFQAGNKLIAQKKGLPSAAKQQLIISNTELELGKQCFNYLKHQIQKLTSVTDSPVWIPFAERLAEVLPADKGTDNRTTNRLFTIINMIALTKAHLRNTLIYDNERLVIATLEDLREALHVVQNVTGIPPHKIKFYKEYILKLYKSKNGTPLKSRDICDFYNTTAQKGTPKINTDAVNRTYLEELVNASYVERQSDPDDKRGYVYQPLVDVEGEEGEEQKVSPISQLKHCDNFLHISKLFLPENHIGIPSDWLKQEILQLQRYRNDSSIFRIVGKIPEEKEVTIDEFIAEYEKLHNLADFFKNAPSRCDTSKPREIITSGSSNEATNEEIAINNDDSKEKLQHQPNCDNCDIFKVINKAMKDGEGNNRGYFRKDDFIFNLVIRPNEYWTEDQAEQTLHALVEEGKVIEIESNKFTILAPPPPPPSPPVASRRG